MTSKVDVLRYIAELGARGDTVAVNQLVKRFRISPKAAARWIDRLWADGLLAPTVAGVRSRVAITARRFVLTARGLERLQYWETGGASAGTFELT